jgi:antitoxin component YwqK of YwqJK toxin-antitoxin module
MKKKLISLSTALLLALLSFTGCQKEIEEEQNIDPETESLSKGDNGGDKNECRLTNFTFTYGEYNYHYNNRGLCDEWDISDYGLFKQEYNSRGRLSTSRLYVEGSLINTIRFFYENDKVVREVWYNGNTSEIGDEIFYTYNRKGKMVKLESFLNDYYTIATFTPQGNTSSWKFFIGGSPFYEGYLKHTRPIKNPYLSVHGIEHGFPFVNPSYNSDEWFAAAEKIIIFDENGDPVVLHDYDASQTIWQRGQQNYPLSATYYDLISGTWHPYTFEYENCGRSGGNDDFNAGIAQPSSSASRKLNPIMLLKRHSSKSIKEQAREIRMQLKNK